MKKNSNNINETVQYTDYSIVGLLDSDGGHTVRVLQRTTPSLGFTVLTSFNQSTHNFDAIEAILKSYEDAKDYSFEQHTNLKKDNTKRKSSRVDLNWNTPSGERFKEMLENKKSLAPGKQRDFLTAKKVYEFANHRDLLELNPVEFKAQNGTYPLVEKSIDEKSGTVEITENELTFSNQPLKRKDKVAQIAIAYLARQNSEKYKESPAKLQERWNQIEANSIHIEATLEEKTIGYKLGQYFTFQIEQKYKEACESICRETSIPLDYFIGMHIGDGTFGCEIRIGTQPGRRRRYEIVPFMRVNQSNDSYDLLQIKIISV